MTRELHPTNVFPAINILPLHQATNTMYAKIPVATPEAIQPLYSMLYRFIQNTITLQQQHNIDMWFNSQIKKETIIYKVMPFLAHKTQSMKNSLFYLLFTLMIDVYPHAMIVTTPSKIIMADGPTRMPNPLFDLVLITNKCREYRKGGEFRKSSEFRNVHFHA